MGIFRRREEAEIDLSDEALQQVAEAETPLEEAEEAELCQAAAETAQKGVFAAADEQGEVADAPQPDALAADLLAAEERWQQAAQDVAQHWPQMQGSLPQLVRKMAEISARYGDERLWQRSPKGIMREAAVELFGMPVRPDSGAVSAALQQAHEQGRKLAAERNRAKLGLAPRISRSSAPPLSAEDEIVREMAAARKSGIF